METVTFGTEIIVGFVAWVVCILVRRPERGDPLRSYLIPVVLLIAGVAPFIAQMQYLSTLDSNFVTGGWLKYVNPCSRVLTYIGWGLLARALIKSPGSQTPARGAHEDAF